MTRRRMPHRIVLKTTRLAKVDEGRIGNADVRSRNLNSTEIDKVDVCLSGLFDHRHRL